MNIITPQDGQWAVSDDYVQTPSGLFLPSYEAFEQHQAKRRIKGVDVFAGCGGMSLGAIQAGIEIVAAIEYSTDATLTFMCNLCRWGMVKMHFVEKSDEERMEKCIQSAFKQADKLAANKGRPVEYPLAGTGWINEEPDDVPGVSHVIMGDVRKLTGKRLLEIIGMELGELDVMFGGPPCQGFSVMGKREIMDPRNSLVFDFARLICETQPKTMVMENVPGILTMKTPEGMWVVDKFVQILRDGGFHGAESVEKMLKRPGSIAVANSKRAKHEQEDEEQTNPGPDQMDLFKGGS